MEDFIEKDLVSKALKYAIKCHDGTNHKYDGKSYMVHLEMVAVNAVKYAYLLPENERPFAIAGAYTHDTIEDTRQTYNDVSKELGVDVANIVYALTNDKGKNREERAGENYYSGIKEKKLYVFVKLCDRLANIQYSYSTKSRMFGLYGKEQPEFKNKLYSENGLDDLWEAIDDLLEVNG